MGKPTSNFYVDFSWQVSTLARKLSAQIEVLETDCQNGAIDNLEKAKQYIEGIRNALTLPYFTQKEWQQETVKFLNSRLMEEGKSLKEMRQVLELVLKEDKDKQQNGVQMSLIGDDTTDHAETSQKSQQEESTSLAKEIAEIEQVLAQKNAEYKNLRFLQGLLNSDTFFSALYQTKEEQTSMPIQKFEENTPVAVIKSSLSQEINYLVMIGSKGMDEEWKQKVVDVINLINRILRLRYMDDGYQFHLDVSCLRRMLSMDMTSLQMILTRERGSYDVSVNTERNLRNSIKSYEQMQKEIDEDPKQEEDFYTKDVRETLVELREALQEELKSQQMLTGNMEYHERRNEASQALEDFLDNPKYFREKAGILITAGVGA